MHSKQFIIMIAGHQWRVSFLLDFGIDHIGKKRKFVTKKNCKPSRPNVWGFEYPIILPFNLE